MEKAVSSEALVYTDRKQLFIFEEWEDGCYQG